MATTKTRKAPAKKAPAKPVTKPATPTNCACGCGKPTITEKALFVSGHDARLAGVLGREWARTDLTTEEAEQIEARLASLSDALRSKAMRVAETATRKAAEKAARAEAKAVAKAAFEQAMADLAARS